MFFFYNTAILLGYSLKIEPYQIWSDAVSTVVPHVIELD